MAYDSLKIADLGNPITDLNTIPNLDAADLKAYFDANALQLMVAFNAALTVLGQDKDFFDAWKARLEAINLESGAAASLAAALASHHTQHQFGGPDAIPADDAPTSGSNNFILSKAVYNAIATVNANLLLKADIEGGVVKASQARSLANISHNSSFTLAAAEAEQYLFVGNNAAAVVTIPRDAGNAIPTGASFMVVRMNAVITFAIESGVQVLSNGVWLASGTVGTISSTGASAIAVKYSDGVWWLKCE